MRIWHLGLMILVAAVILALAREAFGRVMLVMLATGLGEVVLGTLAVLTLFRTLGAVGHARGGPGARRGPDGDGPRRARRHGRDVGTALGRGHPAACRGRLMLRPMI